MPMLGPRAQIGVQQHVDALVDGLFADHLRAERATNAALCAVGGDHVLRAHGRRRARGPVGERGRHAGRVLREGRQLGVESELARALLLGECAQHRLEVVLRAQAVPYRTDSLTAGRRTPRHAPLDLLAGERRRPHDEARALGRQPGRAHGCLHAALVEDLHRAHVGAARFWMDGRSRMTLDEQRADPMLRQEERGGEADGAAADDQHRDVHQYPRSRSTTFRSGVPSR